MSSIPNSAMPHARVATEDDKPRTNLASKARSAGRGAAAVAKGALALPLTLGVVATAMLVRRLRKSGSKGDRTSHKPAQLQGIG
jgi:hypothetical protein